MDKDYLEITTPSTPPGFNGSDRSRSSEEQLQRQLTSNASEDAPPPPIILSNYPTSLDTTPIDAARETQQLSLSLVAHVQAFLRHMFPIMPVVNGDEILADAVRLDELTPSRYALIVSLCAATRVQLQLDKIKEETENLPSVDIPSTPQVTGEMLLSMAEMSLSQYSIIDDYSLDSILTSFFLFAGYGNLDNARRAWFYLNQSITLAQALSLTSEEGYCGLSGSEREARRRLFWLLFVTERTFALQHRRPVMLRNRVAKPQIVDSECPAVMHDFVNHIHLFDLLPYSLYEWHPESEGGQQPKDNSLTHTIHSKLCSLQPENSIIESQRFDTLLTQQWLRVSMWRLAFGKKPLFAHNRGLLMPLGIPLDAGKVVMKALDSVGHTSKDCHGIGMEQKLFDIGTSLVDSALIPASSHPSWEVGPRDLLCAVIKALSKVRGCQSHLLPQLMKHSEEFLGNTNPTAHINIQWAPSDVSTGLDTTECPVADEPPRQTDDSVDASNWTLMDEFITWDPADASLLFPSGELDILEEPVD